MQELLLRFASVKRRSALVKESDAVAHCAHSRRYRVFYALRSMVCADPFAVCIPGYAGWNLIERWPDGSDKTGVLRSSISIPAPLPAESHANVKGAQCGF